MYARTDLISHLESAGFAGIETLAAYEGEADQLLAGRGGSTSAKMPALFVLHMRSQLSAASTSRAHEFALVLITRTGTSRPNAAADALTIGTTVADWLQGNPIWQTKSSYAIDLQRELDLTTWRVTSNYSLVYITLTVQEI